MAKKYMSPSDRLVHELKIKINTFKFLEVFTNWRPEDFGKVDTIVAIQREFEFKTYGYYQNPIPKRYR